MDKAIERSFISQLNRILYFSMKYDQEFVSGLLPDGDSLEIDFEYIHFISNGEVLMSIEPVRSWLAPKNYYSRTELADNIFVVNLEDGETNQWNLSSYVANRLESLILELLGEIKLNYSEKNTKHLYAVLLKEIKRFKVFILEERPDFLLQRYPKLWGVDADEKLLKLIGDHQSNLDLLYLSDRGVSNEIQNDAFLAHVFSLYVLDDVIVKIEKRLERLISVLNSDDDGQPEVTNNGIFFYQGPTQVNRIQQFITYDNSGLVQKNQQKDWVEFLSGQSIPKEPLTWLGPKQHFILFIKHPSYLKDQDATKPLPIELMGKQPSWIKLSPLIVFKDGKPLDNKDTFRSYESLKDLLNNTARYIKDLYSSYKGEE